MIVYGCIAFLLPIAVYCLVLALINRRINPLIVSGVWDSIGLLMACSGALLVCGPGIIYVNFNRASMYEGVDGGHARQEQQPKDKDAREEAEPAETPANVWWVLIYVGYNLVVLAGAAMMVLGRRGKTIIYNVDTDLLEQVLARVLEKCSLAHVRIGRKLFIGPREVAPTPEAITTAAIPGQKMSGTGNVRMGQVDIEPFPAMCHATLHWQGGSPSLREEIEDELRRNLDECRSLDNPAAGWFLGISSLLFFMIIAVVVFFLLIIFVPRR